MKIRLWSLFYPKSLTIKIPKPVNDNLKVYKSAEGKPMHLFVTVDIITMKNKYFSQKNL